MKKKEPELHEVEDVAPGLIRVRTENGWLYCHGKIVTHPYDNKVSADYRLMTFVPDAPPEEPRRTITRKQLRARQKNAEKARESLTKSKK